MTNSGDDPETGRKNGAMDNASMTYLLLLVETDWLARIRQ